MPTSSDVFAEVLELLPNQSKREILTRFSASLLEHHVLMKAILLDAAGTLFEPAEPVGKVYAHFARTHGYELDAFQAEKSFKKTFKELPEPIFTKEIDGHVTETMWWRTLVLRVTQFPENQRFEAFFEELFSYYQKACAWKVFPDTLSFLEKQSHTYRLAVVSNFDARLHLILKNLGLSQYFEFVLSSADARSRKPDEVIFREAIHRLGLSPKDILHIGDSPDADKKGAMRAGMHCSLVNSKIRLTEALARFT